MAQKTTKTGILNDLDIHPRIALVAKKAGYINSWKLLESSLGEIRSKTGLNAVDTERLMKAAAEQCSPPCLTAWQLLEKADVAAPKHIRTGCSNIDALLGGGIPYAGVTEVAGESGSGKTQLALQVALQCQLPVNSGGMGKGVAYICTESQFPVSRLEQLIRCRETQTTFNGKAFSDNIFVHHLPDMDHLLDCVRFQLPQFVSQRRVGLVIVDSVAAVFRASEERQEIKSRMVQQLGFRLRQLGDTQGVAVLAVNQVTSKLDGLTDGMVEDRVVPALGLAWSNLVTTRLMLRRTLFGVLLRRPASSFKRPGKDLPQIDVESGVRTAELVFCPWRPRRSTSFTVTQEGVADVDPSTITLNGA